MWNNNQQIKTNQNKKNKKYFGEKNRESSENDPNMWKEKNSKAKISHAEKDMKTLPTILGSHIQKIMKEKQNREQRDSVQKTMSEGEKRKICE